MSSALLVFGRSVMADDVLIRAAKSKRRSRAFILKIESKYTMLDGYHKGNSRSRRVHRVMFETLVPCRTTLPHTLTGVTEHLSKSVRTRKSLVRWFVYGHYLKRDTRFISPAVEDSCRVYCR
jgi:hypothetical protein